MILCHQVVTNVQGAKVPSMSTTANTKTIGGMGLALLLRRVVWFCTQVSGVRGCVWVEGRRTHSVVYPHPATIIVIIVIVVVVDLVVVAVVLFHNDHKGYSLDRFIFSNLVKFFNHVYKLLLFVAYWI